MSNLPLDFLTAEQKSHFEKYLEPLEYKENTLIFRADSVADDCFLIDSGRVRIELEKEEVDSDQVIGFVSEGNIFGELALLDGRPRSAAAYAHSALKLRRLSKEKLEEMGREDPPLALAFYAFLGNQVALKLRSSNEKLADALFTSTDPEVEELVGKAQAAQEAFMTWSEEKVDALLKGLAEAISSRAEELAEETVKLTRYGNVPDKTRKNRMASMGVYLSLQGRKGFGLTNIDEENRVSEIKAPVGVIFGLIPVTNPVATAIFKTLITLKSRNALILSFHRSTKTLSTIVGEIIQDVLREHGAPVELVQWVKNRNSRKKTEMFFIHPGVSMLLATGGASMVKAAYSSGKPAIGVGAGNAPVLIASDCDLEHAAKSVIMSKSFDNGLICGSEHNLVVVESIYEQYLQTLEACGAAVLKEEEIKRFCEHVLDDKGHAIRPRMVGQSAEKIAKGAGIERPYPIHVLIVPTQEVSKDNPFSREKMCPIIGLFKVTNEEEGIARSLAILENEGKGHTAVIHSKNPELIEQFGGAMPASRILANSPSTHGVIGLTTGLIPSLTLGCGTFGGNSTTDNVTFSHLTNTKRLAHFVMPEHDPSQPTS